ncbi:V-set and immunoglobulin domain-containing protein 10 [Engraulis encrasicolus]|uniref:V-set and immunoglobulin domain-containing protein 10 n=1 Tax=Engraulis encrasicolus TaxID=184585 RepID=UPI002FD4CBF7
MTLAAALLYFVCLCQTVVVKCGADDGSAPLKMFGELEKTVTLPCHDKTANVTPAFTQWTKDGSIVSKRNHTSQPFPTIGHYIILNNGSLDIAGLMTIDEGLYECYCTGRNASIVHTHDVIQLQTFSGPTNVTLDISPAGKLSNGSLYVRNGTDVHFKCSTPSASTPSRTLTWTLEGSGTLISGTDSLIQFEEWSITPARQGKHVCMAENTLSGKRVMSSQELLVYFPPQRHPECSWRTENDSSMAIFDCSWHGGYPLPHLQWEDLTAGGAWLGSAVDNEVLEITLNRSLLTDGMEIQCRGKHIAASEDKICHMTLRIPFPVGEPLVVAVEGTNVTLTCTDDQSVPPAKTVWQRTVEHKAIEQGSKYVMSQEGPVFSLTIVNLTKDDEGTYFCRSENPVDVRELEVYLTVKPSVSYTGGIVGTFLSVIILGVGIAVGMAAYNNRHKICLSKKKNELNIERNDVLNLVDSDDEEIFQDTVPRLPVVPNGNGNATTLVEIHRIPSSDHEEQDNNMEGSQENQDTATETA